MTLLVSEGGDLEQALRAVLPFLQRDYQAVVDAERRLRTADTDEGGVAAAELLRHVLDTGLFRTP